MSTILLGSGAAAVLGSILTLRLARRRQLDSQLLAVGILSLFVIGIALIVKGFTL